MVAPEKVERDGVITRRPYFPKGIAPERRAGKPPVVELRRPDRRWPPVDRQRRAVVFDDVSNARRRAPARSRVRDAPGDTASEETRSDERSSERYLTTPWIGVAAPL